jgi:hypothetical protein
VICCMVSELRVCACGDARVLVLVLLMVVVLIAVVGVPGGGGGRDCGCWCAWMHSRSQALAHDRMLNRKPSTAHAEQLEQSWSETKRIAHLVPVSLRAALHNQQQDQASRSHI